MTVALAVTWVARDGGSDAVAELLRLDESGVS
jgi:hypothetical protein